MFSEIVKELNFAWMKRISFICQEVIEEWA